ncbi:hypothetical protein HMPREF1549_00333, partial [Actinomyces johnsonii F0510]
AALGALVAGGAEESAVGVSAGGFVGCSATTSSLGLGAGPSAMAAGLTSPMSVTAVSVPIRDRQECFIIASSRAWSSFV